MRSGEIGPGTWKSGGFLQDIHNREVEERTNVTSFKEAIAVASRDEGFKATAYAMNTLLIHKGIYTYDEVQAPFVEWAQKEQKSAGVFSQSQQ